PPLEGDRAVAENTSRDLFRNFAMKLADLWRYESGQPIASLFGHLTGWEHFRQAQATRRGVLLLTPHLGNWEFGAPVLAQRGGGARSRYRLRPVARVSAAHGPRLRRPHPPADTLRRRVFALTRGAPQTDPGNRACF